MAEFDPVRALKEEITSLGEISTALSRRLIKIEKEYTEAEVEMNSVAKLRGFALAELDRKREALRKMEEEEGK